MWKFKASKFKNAAPKIPRKEDWVSDVQAANLLQSCGTHVSASGVFVTFNTDAGGAGSLGILPLSAKGRQTPGSIPHLRAHAGFVTDFMFSPFDDFKLATTAHDGMVKLWQLPAVPDLDTVPPQPLTTLTQAETHVELVLWHPTTHGLLATTAAKQIALHDVETQQADTFELHPDHIQSAYWREDGSVLVTSCKDKKLRIVDLRANSVVTEASGHPNMRDSRVVWLGNKDHIISSGFDSMRSREVSLRDCRNLSSTICTKSFDSSAAVMIPLYDSDTGMLYLASKGDTCLRYTEATDKDIVENFSDTVEQIKGFCLVPKRAMDVLKCEVNRVMLLTHHALIPLPYHVPRKSYTEFHGDLFPDTARGVPALTAQQWRDGQNAQVQRMTLNPATNPMLVITGDTKPCPASDTQPAPTGNKPAVSSVSASASPAPKKADSPAASLTKASDLTPAPAPTQPLGPTPAQQQPKEPTPEPEPVKPSALLRAKKATFNAVRQSKFRHLEGKPDHKDLHLDNLRNLSKSVPGESDLFYANRDFCVVPLAGSGGLVAVLKTSNPGRLPDTGVPGLQNGSQVMDTAWDPFNNRSLAVGCDDAKIRIWTVPEEGLTETLTEPDENLIGHQEKIYFLKYHPLASNVLASGAYDMTVRIWDTAETKERIQLTGHTDTIFCFAWSADGRRAATVCKDGLVRVYDPRASTQPIKEGPGPKGTRGARVVWACQDQLLVVTGFSKSSERQLLVYSPDDLAAPLHVRDLDVTPAILVPHLDADSGTLFLSARGERSVQAFEVVTEAPYLYPLSSYNADDIHQALAFLPKDTCHVAKVEFARALRLTQHSVEPIGFSVPRVKTQYFQDDLYPDTQVTWEPVISADRWFSGQDEAPRTMSLRPANMDLLSEAPVEAPKAKKYESYNPDSYKTEDQKKDELLGAMMGKFEISGAPLPQDLTEGVDEDEWDDY